MNNNQFNNYSGVQHQHGHNHQPQNSFDANKNVLNVKKQRPYDIVAFIFAMVGIIAVPIAAFAQVYLGLLALIFLLFGIIAFPLLVFAILLFVGWLISFTISLGVPIVSIVLSSKSLAGKKTSRSIAFSVISLIVGIVLIIVQFVIIANTLSSPNIL